MAPKVNIKPLLPDLDRPEFDIKPTHRIWSFLPLLLLIVGLGVALSQTLKTQNIFTQASGGAVLSVAPERSVVRPGDVFIVNLLLDPKDAQIKDVYLALSYPVEDLELVDPGLVHTKIHFDVNPVKVEVLTSVKFKAVRTQSKVTIGFSKETWVAGEDKVNILSRTFATDIEIK